MSDDVWSAQATTPSAIDSALRDLLADRHRRSSAFVPARVLNLVTIVDDEFTGEVENRLDGLRESNPSRLILCKVRSRQQALDAIASIGSDGDEPIAGSDGGEPIAGTLAVGREKIELTMAPRHVDALDTIVGPLVVGDLPTVVWAPHGHRNGVDALRRHAQVVLLDSQDEPGVLDALVRAQSLSEHLGVVDLAWLRSAPWRERVAATFDPPDLRRALSSIVSVTVRHRHDSAATGLLFCGWLASRLGWRVGSLSGEQGRRRGRMRARRGEVTVSLEAVELRSPGLGGVTIQAASGESVSLDRAPGGLRFLRRAGDGSEQEWTVLGASRGEAGILADGVRHALLRDRIYPPSLQAAHAMAA